MLLCRRSPGDGSLRFARTTRGSERTKGSSQELAGEKKELLSAMKVNNNERRNARSAECFIGVPAVMAAALLTFGQPSLSSLADTVPTVAAPAAPAARKPPPRVKQSGPAGSQMEEKSKEEVEKEMAETFEMAGIPAGSDLEAVLRDYFTTPGKGVTKPLDHSR